MNAVSSPGRSFSIGKIPLHGNALKCPSLFLREFEGPYAHIGPRAGRKPCNEVRITYAVDERGIAGWIEEDDPERMLSSTALAEKYLIIVLEHAKDEPSSWSPSDSDDVK